jgi:sulfonate transport system substrate-binding protein
VLPRPRRRKLLLRIGYQKAANTLVLLKAHGALEKRLQPLGVEVKWAEFAAGPQLLEALNVGSVDFGYVGEAPPVFAQAAGADFVYTAYEIPTPDAEGLLVQKDSPIKSVAELKGKKVAFNKGSTCTGGGLAQESGLQYSDIQPVYLPRPMPAPPSSAVRSMPGRSGIRSRPPPKSRSAHVAWPRVWARSATTSSS